jgi:malonyl CoA-acyl carrier protein transacylase
MDQSAERAVAIVGLGCMLPDAPTVSDFWNNITHRRYSINPVPADRWNVDDYYDADYNAPDKTYSTIGGWVRGFEFDWKRYKIPPKVAAAMDEGQQWALTIASQALADYGYPDRPLDTERTAVILGTAMGGELHYKTYMRAMYPEYARAIRNLAEFQQLPAQTQVALLEGLHGTMDATLPPITEDSMPGELPNIVSGRIANALNLHGPNFITDAACAASFAAINSAVEMLTEHHVDAVVTGGVDRNMGAAIFIKFCKIGALSATGSRPFGDGADGFVMGEGAAAFVLKRLEDAERAGDRIYAVIRGVGGSSDGRGKGITAPNPIGQQFAVQRAWENAGLDPATATLVEAHGTSTRVGDVVEVESLSSIYGGAGQGSIGLGSVKSNIGHLKAGAGAAGLLKATLAVHHKVLPPTLNAERPNPNIDFARSPFRLIHEAQAWERNGTPRRCGVSAYGFGGTNFHIVLEEHVPGALTNGRKTFAAATVPSPVASVLDNAPSAATAPLRGILALGAATPTDLKDKLDAVVQRVENGWQPPRTLPAPVDLQAQERLVIDFGEQDELLRRLHTAQKAMGFDSLQAWKPLQSQGIFRGSGGAPGKVAFMFPGQGSQYVNMCRDLAAVSPLVTEVIAEADRIMTPILGRKLTDYIFVDNDDASAINRAELDLMQTAITQPAMLTMDIAILRLLESYGFKPDIVMGHSLGEYAALIAAGIMPFAHALEAAAARGSEMSKIEVEDNGAMAAVIAPFEAVEAVLKSVEGYVVPANINSRSQSVIGGATPAVQRAVDLFIEQGYKALPLPVSHAFHTQIVAPTTAPLRQVLDRLHIAPPTLPLIANVTGDLYPTTVDAIKDLLQQQIASPVQWVKGLETLYNAGVRMFVEVGPKRALKGFADDVFGSLPDVQSLLTNHPKTGDLASFNQAICGLYAAGYAAPAQTEASEPHMSSNATPAVAFNMDALQQVVSQAVQDAMSRVTINGAPAPAAERYDRNAPPLGSVVITGTGLGLPGAEKPVMDSENALRILRGEQFIDLIPERFRKRMLTKRITRLVKAEDGNNRFETINDPGEVIKLAGRPGKFDLAQEYGVPEKLIEALDTTTQLAIAAGLDALREAGIPLVMTYRPTTTGKHLPERWMLPEALRDDTGVIFASAFPGGDRFVDEFTRYFTYQSRLDQISLLNDLRSYITRLGDLDEIDRRISDLREQIEREPYEFDRRFIFRILAMGHSQFAEYIGARGPNTHVNAACASTTQALGVAEDWIRSGRCQRVVIVASDNVTSENLMEWIGAGFLATGAAATDDRVEEAALPFDRRRHGTILGMGACALVVESEDVVRERGMRGIIEMLSTETRNSAFHGTRLDVAHISQVMDDLVRTAELRFGLNRSQMAAQTVFMSHETFTPARGGSAAAEIVALRHVFGSSAKDIIIANTKGFTGHPMGVGIEDVIALKILEHGIVPPVPNFKEIDHDLGTLNLSRGGRYNVQYSLHLSAGFGSQIAMSLTRRIPGALDRLDDRPRYQRWLDEISGYDQAETEIERRVLRIKERGVPQRQPAATRWQYGTGPSLRVRVNGASALNGNVPARPMIETPPSVPVASTPSPSRSGQGELTTDDVYVAPTASGVSVGTPHEASAMSTPSSAPTLTPNPSPSGRGEPIAPAAPAVDPVVAQVLEIVSKATGYPTDMLDLDLDLEADLGVDTVKQAETFAAIRAAFDIPRRDDLRLRDYTTLAKVIGFVHTMRPDLVATDKGMKATDEVYLVPTSDTVGTTHVSSAMSTPSSVPTLTPNPSPSGRGESIPPTIDPVVAQVLEIVSKATGYPTEMLDLDLDLEADLGVDTVKQAETFAAIRNTFNIPRRDDLRLRDYTTLAKVIGFVHTMRPDLAAPLTPAPSPSGRGESATDDIYVVPTTPYVSVGTRHASSVTTLSAPTASPTPTTPAVDPVVAQVLEIVSKATGYPTDMLDLDLDLEADLGVDTVKQAETFAAIRNTFNIPRRDDLKLRDYTTLAKVIGFVHTMRPDLVATDKGMKATDEVYLVPTSDTVGTTHVSSVSESSHVAPHTAARLEDADRMPRRVVVPTLRPALDECKPTGVTLNASSRVVVMLDHGGVGKALVSRLEKLGVTPLLLDNPAIASDTLEAQLRTWLTEGAVQGIYWLPALDVEPDLEQLDLMTWRELNRQRVKNLSITMRVLYNSVNQAGTFLVSATRLGGLHGYGVDGATAPLGGAVVGFTKAYKRERNEVLVKAVDFENGRKTALPADALIAETLTDPGVVEVGYWNEQRWSPSFIEQPAADGQPGLTLNRETVFVVTGAAGGITSAIIADLAAASGGIFYLLDLVAPPNADDPLVTLFRQDREALKTRLIEDAKATGERLTPVQIEKRIAAIEREEAALRAIESVTSVGGTAHYHSVNLLDGAAISAVVDEIRAQYGRIDALIHAGGLEISRALSDKDAAQFDLVFDVKADGFFSLLRAAQGMPIGATVVFSSVAGRFGNSGQTDYSAANDLLCKISSSLRRWRPETRAIAIDWTAWGGIGMATRGSIPKIMEMAGIDMLPPEAGIPTVRRELVAGGFRGEIVVGGRLGILVQEWDTSGGLDVGKANARLMQWSPPSAVLGKVISAGLYDGLTVETVLDPNVQSFLYDHAMEGTPLLPGVMGTETFAQLACLLAPGYTVAAVSDVRFDSPFKFYRMEAQTLHLTATASPIANGDILVRTQLGSARQLATGETQHKTHFYASVRLTRAEVAPPQIAFTPPVADALPIVAGDIYRVYFHGPAYQVLECVGVSGDRAVGLFAQGLPPNSQPADAASVMAPRLVELCFQTAGIWEIRTKGVLALPLALQSVTTYRPTEAADGRLYALVTTIDNGATFDADVVDTQGNVYVALHGYRTVQLPGSVTL